MRECGRLRLVDCSQPTLDIPYLKSQILVLYRSAKRGLAVAQMNGSWPEADHFQHILDELERLRIASEGNNK